MGDEDPRCERGRVFDVVISAADEGADLSELREYLEATRCNISATVNVAIEGPTSISISHAAWEREGLQALITRIYKCLLERSDYHTRNLVVHYNNNNKVCKYQYKHVAVGGTFDRLHAGHRLLLAMAAIYSGDSVSIGVTTADLIARKADSHLIEAWQVRADNCVRFVRQCNYSNNTLNKNVQATPLTDSTGIAASNPEIDALVISKETIKGGKLVNEQRSRNGFEPLKLIVVDLLHMNPAEKLSSSFLRSNANSAATSNQYDRSKESIDSTKDSNNNNTNS